VNSREKKVKSWGVKKNCDTVLSMVVVKNAKKNFLCTFNDQFEQIFFVGGVIFTEKIKKIRLTRCK